MTTTGLKGNEMADDLTWAPVWRLSELIQTKDVTPVEVLEHFLARITEHNPALHALEHLDEDRARADAKAAERRMLAGEAIGVLDGIPLAVKGHIPIQGTPLSDPFGKGPERLDDVSVERLRGAGAVIVGHATMPKYTSEGAFDWYATARNPWDVERTPGVSGTGGAATVAAALLPAVVGSDGAGSSRLPSAYSGVVGVHPTAGLVPWVDHNHYATRLGSTLGPMTRDVRDAAEILSVIAGPDGRDHLGLQIEQPDPRSELGLGAQGLKLAWTDDFGFARNYPAEESDRVIAHIRQAALALNGIGATVEPADETWEDYLDAALIHGAVYTGMPIMGPEAGAAISDADWDAATAVRQNNWLRFRKLFREYDLLLSPTIHSIAPTLDVFTSRAPAPVFDRRTPGHDSFVVYTSIFNWLGFPAVSVPCGFVDGMPVGLQIVGPPGSDARILRVAQAFLEAFPRDERPVGYEGSEAVPA